MKFYELYLAQSEEGLNTVIAMVPGRSKAEAHDLAKKEYRRKHNLLPGINVISSTLNESDTLAEGEEFHKRLMARIEEEKRNGN